MADKKDKKDKEDTQLTEEVVKVAAEIVSLKAVTNKLVAFGQKDSDRQTASDEKLQQERLDVLNQEILAGDGRTKEIRALKAEAIGIQDSFKATADANAQLVADSAAALGMSEDQYQSLLELKANADKSNAYLESLGQSLLDAGLKPEDLDNVTEYSQASAEAAEANNLVAESSLENAPSKAEEAETKTEAELARKELGGYLKQVAGGLGGLLEQGKQKIKDAAGGAFKFIKGLAIAGLALAVVGFLNSDAWIETKKYIMEELVPKIRIFVDAFKKGFGEGFSALVDDRGGLGGIVLALGAVGAAFALFKIFTWAKQAIAAFKVLKTGMLLVKSSVGLANVGFFPIIAIAAGIALIIGALKVAFDDFQKTMEETGSVTEALKVGAAKFVGFLIGYPIKLVADLIGWVLNKLGFENVAKKLQNFVGDDPIQSIADAVKDVFDGIGEFFSTLPAKISSAMGNMGDVVKNFIKSALQMVLPKPGGSITDLGFWASKAIPDSLYKYAGMNPETGEIIPPVITDQISPNPAMAGNVAGRPDFENLMDSRSKQLFDAKLAQTSGGAPVVVNAPSTNVVNSNSNSSVSHISTPLKNDNAMVAALNSN